MGRPLDICLSAAKKFADSSSKALCKRSTNKLIDVTVPTATSKATSSDQHQHSSSWKFACGAICKAVGQLDILLFELDLQSR